MGNLIRMDLYRIRKTKTFIACLVIAFLFALATVPLEKLLTDLSLTLAEEGTEPIAFETKISLAGIIGAPASSITLLTALLSIVFFFYADMEAGYIKNIAGQMPKKGFSILSRYIASVPHNLTFMLVDILGNLIGNLFLRKITMDGSLVEAVGIFLLRLLLLQGITAILLLVTSAFRSKSFGMILAVLLGLPLMWLIYSAINSGLEKIIKNANIIPYMPDQVIRESTPDAVRGFLVAAVTIAIFLPVSIRVFDQKDVK